MWLQAPVRAGGLCPEGGDTDGTEQRCVTAKGSKVPANLSELQVDVWKQDIATDDVFHFRFLKQDQQSLSVSLAKSVHS